MNEFFFHPKVVHLPIALAVLMPVVSAGIALAWWRKWLPERAWFVAVALQATLVLSGFGALRSGEREAERVEPFVGEHLVEAHEEAAETFVSAGAGVLGLMVMASLLRRRSPGLPLAGLSALGALVVLGLGARAGEAGGSLVYEHGAAGAYVKLAPAGSPALSVRPTREDHDGD